MGVSSTSSPCRSACGEGGSGGEGERVVALSSASWGFGPQASGGEEIVGERMPERVSLGLDETAHGKKTEAMVLAVGVDPLDALAQSIDSLARFARHAFPPFLEAKGFFRPLADPARQRGRLDLVSFSLGGGV